MKILDYATAIALVAMTSMQKATQKFNAFNISYYDKPQFPHKKNKRGRPKRQ